MATISRTLSPKIAGDGSAEILLRLTVCRGKQFRIKSGVYVSPTRFRDGAFRFPRLNTTELQQLKKRESTLLELESYLLQWCRQVHRDEVTPANVKKAVERFRDPLNGGSGADFNKVLDTFLSSKDISDSRLKQYEVLRSSVGVFLKLRARERAGAHRADFSTFTDEDLAVFEKFLYTEHEICVTHPDLYAARRRKQHPRGRNTVTGLLKLLRTFFKWCHTMGLTDHDPFLRFHISRAVYGSPFYITLRERDRIECWDFSASPALDAQRDVFIFQCYIGCRISDLYRLTRANIVSGAIEYIPEKTKGERAEVVRVPIHPRAAAILKKYEGNISGILLPLISQQRYNDHIKEIFTACGLTRTVSVLDPLTGAEERRPLNELASSHLARRTFVGNLYKQVKDPALVGSLSGHKEGSRAFSRYRDIDEELRRDVVNLLGAAERPDAGEGVK